MAELTLSMEAMQTIATAEDVILKQARKQILKEGGGSGPGQLSIQILDLVEEEDKLTFMVAKGQLGLALGKGARNLQALKNVFNKDVKIVEFDEELERFVRNCFKPHNVEAIGITSDDDTIVGVSGSTTDADDDDDDGSDDDGGSEAGDEQTGTAPEDKADADGPDADDEDAEPAKGFTAAAKANVQVDEGETKNEPRFIVRVTIDAEDKGKAIGKGGRNINVIRTLVRRHHNVVELKVE